MSDQLAALEAEMERLARDYQPGDRLHRRTWPEDRLVNIDADARMLAAVFVNTFRRILTESPNDADE